MRTGTPRPGSGTPGAGDEGDRADGSSRRYTYETTTSRLKQTKDPKLQEITVRATSLDDKLCNDHVNASTNA